MYGIKACVKANFSSHYFRNKYIVGYSFICQNNVIVLHQGHKYLSEFWYTAIENVHGAFSV